jgi:uncharacterized protein DUF3460
MNKHYISEFAIFIAMYLREHPEVVKDQEEIWNIYWSPKKVDLEELNSLEKPWRCDR